MRSARSVQKLNLDAKDFFDQLIKIKSISQNNFKMCRHIQGKRRLPPNAPETPEMERA